VQEQFNQHHSQPSCIFIVDETATGAVPTRNSKVTAATVRRQVGMFLSTKRGHKATTVLCMPTEWTLILSW